MTEETLIKFKELQVPVRRRCEDGVGNYGYVDETYWAQHMLVAIVRYPHPEGHNDSHVLARELEVHPVWCMKMAEWVKAFFDDLEDMKDLKVEIKQNLYKLREGLFITDTDDEKEDDYGTRY